MAKLSAKADTSDGKIVRLRVRPDLVFRQQTYQGRPGWVVKEPLGLQYARLGPEEHFLLTMLDGQLSLPEIKERMEERFPPKQFRPDELHHWISIFNRMGLVMAPVPEQGDQLRKRADKRRRDLILSTFSNLLAIRFRGVNPNRFFNWLYPKIRWFFSPWAVAVCLCMISAALASIIVNLSAFQTRLPAFHEFFGPSNWFVLSLAIVITKVLHEFGHGLTCKHHGGECPELGVLLLVLTPCLYCNVSDSWLLPSKWRRAAIGAAGMYVELVIASLATFAWWNSSPGTFNQLCLGIMFMCSVSTLVFNGNPLLRYDGYYILSDLIEVPNLRQKSQTALQRLLKQWCLGMDLPPDYSLPQRHLFLFACYSVASFVYGWMVVGGIIWFLHKALEPYGLKVIGQAFALAAVVGMLFPLVRGLWQFASVPGKMDDVKSRNVRVTVLAVLAILVVVAFVPLPRRVWCAAEIKLRDADGVYVSVSGRLVEIFVKPGQAVEAGQKLARLENFDLEKKILELQGQRAEYEAREIGLIAVRGRDPQAAAEANAIRESLTTVKDQLRKKEHEAKRLILVASRAGVVIAPPEIAPQPDNDDRLPQWSGTPFDENNANAWLAETTLFCQIGDPQVMQADLVVDQADVDFVSVGQEVAVKLDELPSETIGGTVVTLGRQEMKIAPKHISQRTGGEVVTHTDASGTERLQSTSYQANVAIGGCDIKLRPGLRGQANVYVPWESLGTRIVRLLAHTFHFKW